MNMKRMIIYLFALVPGLAWAGTTPAIKNVKASQNPTFKNVDIYYDLDAPASAIYKVSIEATSGGQCLPTKSLSGDVGQVNAGKNKKIVWQIAADWPNHKASDVEVTVSAERVGGNPSSYDDITADYIAYVYESGDMKTGKFIVKAYDGSTDQYFIYRTVQGRYGKFFVSHCWCGVIDLSFVTYDNDGKVYKKGTASLSYNPDMSIKNGMDFDTGKTSNGSASSIDMKSFWDGDHGTSEHWVQAYGAMKKMK